MCKILREFTTKTAVASWTRKTLITSESVSSALEVRPGGVWACLRFHSDGLGKARDTSKSGEQRGHQIQTSLHERLKYHRQHRYCCDRILYHKKPPEMAREDGYQHFRIAKRTLRIGIHLRRNKTRWTEKTKGMSANAWRHIESVTMHAPNPSHSFEAEHSIFKRQFANEIRLMH